MRLIIYGDFNCPYSYLASQRADRLRAAGRADTEWRAVEHDRSLPLTGAPSAPDQAAWERELAEVRDLALPGERVPSAPPPLISNTGAAVAAYAEAVTDGVQDELRRRIFHAIWGAGQHLGSATGVRALVAGLLWPAAPLTPNLASPDLPRPLNRLPSVAAAVRRSGGTIAPDGGPLTAAGHRRIQRWRQDWQSAAHGTVPVVVTGQGDTYRGVAALTYLAGLAAPVRPASGTGRSRRARERVPAGATA